MGADLYLGRLVIFHANFGEDDASFSSKYPRHWQISRDISPVAVGSIVVAWRVFGVLAIGLIPVAFLNCTSDAKAASADVERCIHSKTPNDKVYYCSIALRGRPGGETTDRLLLRRGNALMQLGIFSEAVKDFSRLIVANPTAAGYVDNRLAALRSLGLYQEALADANHAVDLAPHKAFVYHSRGLVFEDLKQFAAALNDFDQAISLDPNNARLMVERARIKAEAGRTSEAIEDLSRAIAQDPGNLAALKQRGMTHLALGDLNAAAIDLLAYSRVVPDDPEVATAIATIRPAASRKPSTH
ncbi:tetratricopeptide repeat protein [Mesorhizobium huakuii]|uniref:Tetratricopeptide repeat protein n=1 Tax=Mesorhizobium huakuii TaxID=28104 RepID=A0ABZ0VRQ1_9HYPH|nr:tetratricopeptide repeat protein [Mesorhizobium huakuii]WQB99930.1 tetratricopeptide repeat protein [Mesorhizobium huakuii]